MFTPPSSPLPPVSTEVNPFEETLKLSPASSNSLEVPDSPPRGSHSFLSPPLSPPPPRYKHDSNEKPVSRHVRNETLESFTARQESKRRLTYRLRWASLLIPLALIIVTVSTHYVSHPAALDWFGAGGEKEFEGFFTIHKRHPQNDDSGQSSFISLDLPTSSASTSSSSSTSTATASTSVPTIPSSSNPPALPTPFPQPWDSSIGLNFSTSACLNFFQNMTNTSPFRSCRPFGLLTYSSSDFVDAQSNLTLLNSILWGTCNPPLGADQCTSNMAWFADEIKDACKQELGEKNENVVRTRVALLSYPLLLSASCLPLASTNTYCYISSMASGASSASDIYLYSLALGIPFPTSASPSCSACERNLLGVFGNELSQDTTSASSSSSKDDPVLNLDDSSPAIGLKSTYSSAVSIVNGACGASFVATTEASHSSSNSASSSLRLQLGTGAVVGMGMVVSIYMALGW